MTTIEKKMLRIAGIHVIFMSFALPMQGQQQDSTSKKISLLFIGDIMGHDEQIKAAEKKEDSTFNYDEVFRYIQPVISDADIAIANFEVTLAGPPYKGYPQFSSPAALAAACKNAGIDYLVTANNHSVDRGIKGLKGTILRLDSLEIPHTGTFLDQAARDSLYPLIIQKEAFTLALLNYTYGTNGLKVPSPLIVNMLDTTLISKDIEKAKLTTPDAIILFLHWGTEYDTVPSKSQEELAEFFFSKGVDLVIGSHPHVLQKMVWQRRDSTNRDRVAVYSLGNFISNQRRPGTDGGTMVRIEISKKDNDIYISDAGYYLTWVYTPVGNSRKRFFILPCTDFENNPGFFSTPAEFGQMKKFLKTSRSLLYRQNVNFLENVYPGNSWQEIE